MEQHEAKTRRTVVTSLSTAFHVLGLLLTFLVGIVAYLTGIFYTFAIWLILAYRGQSSWDVKGKRNYKS